MKARAPIAIVGLLATGALSGCSLMLDFGGSDGDDAAPARVDAAMDASPLPPAFDGGGPDAATIDPTTLCTADGDDPIDPVTGTCYVLLETGAPITEARATCTALGGHLATIRARAEEDVFLGRLAAAPYWLGLGDAATESAFTWETAEPLDYVNWRAGEPNDVDQNEDCVVVYGNYVGEYAPLVGLWDDRDCENSMRAVCELEKTRDGL